MSIFWLVLTWPVIFLLWRKIRSANFTPRKPRPPQQVEVVDAEFEAVEEEQPKGVDIRV